VDIKDLSEQQIMEMLKRGETIPYYQDLASNPFSKPALGAFPEILGQEEKLSRALSRGISEQKGFHGKTRTQDIIKELSSDMGVDTPELKFQYDPQNVGSMDTQRGILSLNPELAGKYGKEAVISHELRHLKEASPGHRPDLSVRRMLYTSPEENITALERLYGVPHAIKQEEGKSLSYYNKVKDRLFKNDKLKPSIDALSAYDFLEKGHFKSSFLKKNLERVAKGLPIIGAAATVLGAAGYSDQAGAAVDMATGPLGGVEEMGVSDEQKDLDIQYLNRIRQLSQRNK
jgi:hypothetical protein